MSEPRTVTAMRSALAQAGVGQGGFDREELAFREIESRAAVRLRALGPRPGSRTEWNWLPCDTGSCSGKDPAILCLRPGDWLMVSQSLGPHDLLEELGARPGDADWFTWDLSEGLALFRLEGEAAPWLLRKHCGLDIPVDSPATPHCAQTRFGHINVLMHYHVNETAGAFDLYMDRSLAVYLWNLLEDSANHAVQMYRDFAAARGASADR